MAAIEAQSSTSQRTYLARLLVNLFAINENTAGGTGDGGGQPVSCNCSIKLIPLISYFFLQNLFMVLQCLSFMCLLSEI